MFKYIKQHSIPLLIIFLISFLLAIPNTKQEETQTYIIRDIDNPENIISEHQTGVASWYDYDLNRKDQKCLANNCYSMFNATCASRYFKRGSILTVINLDTLEKVDCRVNDYGPEEWTERAIDLSSFAFNKIAPLKKGVVRVEILLKK